MTNSKLENIENGIIKLLWQKYMIDTYKEVNIYKQSKINKNRLKENVINNDNQVSENIDNLLDSIASIKATSSITPPLAALTIAAPSFIKVNSFLLKI